MEADAAALQLALARHTERLGRVEEKILVAEHSQAGINHQLEQCAAQNTLQGIALARLSRRLANVEQVLTASRLN